MVDERIARGVDEGESHLESMAMFRVFEAIWGAKTIAVDDDRGLA